MKTTITNERHLPGHRHHAHLAHSDDIHIPREVCVEQRHLQLSDNHPRIRVRQDLNNPQRLYISRSWNDSGYHTVQRKDGKCRIINSVSLSIKLKMLLDGYGTYKICEDSPVIEDDIISYEIFFKKVRSIQDRH